jgi:cytochrome c oxidase assembly protein subunit 15
VSAAPSGAPVALHRFAVLTAIATALLLAAGGLVTSTGSALSVPDWPLSFGQVFPEMRDGVLFEHGHRLIASGVGLLVVALAVWIGRREPRRWVRRLGFAAVAAVVLQGLLGGLTVLMRLPLAVSVAHSCLGQAFFCIVVTIAAVTSPRWPRREDSPAAGRVTAPVAAAAGATAGILFLQLVLGALVRHTGSGLAIPDFPLAFGRLVPPTMEGQIGIAFLHRAGAVLAAAAVLITATLGIRRHRTAPSLVIPSIAMTALTALQIALGGATVLTGLAVVPATAHVVTGAILLATSVLLALRAARMAGAARVEATTRRSAGAPAAAGWVTR